MKCMQQECRFHDFNVELSVHMWWCLYGCRGIWTQLSETDCQNKKKYIIHLLPNNFIGQIVKIIISNVRFHDQSL